MIAAYCWPQSALPEETIKIFCHTEAESFQFTVFRQGKNIEKIIEIRDLEGKLQTISPDISVEGCDWDPSFELVIDPNWNSGEDADGNEIEVVPEIPEPKVTEYFAPNWTGGIESFVQKEEN